MNEPHRMMRRLWHVLACLLLGTWAGAAQTQTTPAAAPTVPASAAMPAQAQVPTQAKASDPTPAEAKGETKGEGTASALVPSTDGAYVLDAQNKLAWLRCVEGMTWTGLTCVGEPRLMTYTTAQALAAARAKADGVAWRIPRMHELRRIKESVASTALFPADPHDWTWSGNASINIAQTNQYDYDNIASASSNRQERLTARLGWAVHLGNGDTRGDVSRRTALVVRLVRPYQP